MIKINEFRQNLRNIVRPNRFFVTIDGPIKAPSMDILKYMVRSAKIPERVNDSIDLKFHGMDYQVIGDLSHEDLTITFINDYEWLTRDFFEEWMELNRGVEDNSRIPSNDVSTGSSITVYQVGNKEIDILAAYKYFDVIPKRVGEIELQQDSEGTFEIFSVTFSYTYWKRV